MPGASEGPVRPVIHTLEALHGYPLLANQLVADPLHVQLEEPEWHPVRSRRPLVLTLAALAAVLLLWRKR